MNAYDEHTRKELEQWQHKMLQRPSYLNKLTRRLQGKLNSYIPQKVHSAITVAIKQMFRAVLFGAELVTNKKLPVNRTLEMKEQVVREKIRSYRNMAATEGAITGAGGILLGLADFPLLLSLKIKLLLEIAVAYGFNISDYRERLFVLYIFKLAFSTHETRRQTYLEMVDWKDKAASLPEDIHALDWQSLQQEYRDYIDLAKMAQLVPVIGTPVGAIANYQLIKKLGDTAMNAYRMRLLNNGYLLK